MGVGVVAWVVLGGVVVLPILDGLDEGNGSVNDVGDVRNRRISLSNSEIAAMAVNAPCFFFGVGKVRQSIHRSRNEDVLHLS